MDYVYLGIFICSIAFLLIVVFASITLKRAANTMVSLSNALDEVEQKMNWITPEIRQSLQESGYAVDDIEDKLAATDSLFASLHDLGFSMDESSKFASRQTEKVIHGSSPKNENRLISMVTWFDVAYKLYKRQKDQP